MAGDSRGGTRDDLLPAAREAFRRRDWQASYDLFARAQRSAPLDVGDLDGLAISAWRIGRCKESVRHAEQVFSELVRTDRIAAAAKAVDVALAWLTRGDLNIGQGWMSRARRLVEDAPDGPTRAYLVYLEAWIADLVGDVDCLQQRAETLRAMSERLGSPVVTAMGLIVDALAAIKHVRMREAFGLFDEAMLPVLADDVPLEWAGDIYCLVLHHCHRVADAPRMRAWTESMRRWCDDVASSPTYGSLCEVYRLQLHAATDDCRTLEDKLSATSSILEEINTFAAAEAYYQLGEARRMRGDVTGALTAFGRAREMGCDPQPGEALVRLQQGDTESAWTSLQMALGWQDRIGRIRLLLAAVEVALARNDVEEAETLCRELEEGATDYGTRGFRAWAAHARGAVLTTRGQYEQALDAMCAALREYRAQQCRYETAEVYQWMARAHAGLGQQQVAAADQATAQSIYRQLGTEKVRHGARVNPGGLTNREREILCRIASGGTNKQVAQQFVISEKTVARHLANIYTKLGVSSRTGAVSWAYANDVVGGDGLHRLTHTTPTQIHDSTDESGGPRF
ncbi:LuxR family transcriptional regulator [Mycobacterium sp. 1274761.0]|uniref:LuxR family transcriptional regulator n=1 Tax=Mycobacterium sp. 1274761.0 TaxID=1834077 RepID=UPI0008008C7C|nr:LuxR family transcriptional regulator [Mycobacterium sp. 1274761.0]OBK74971.1 helix-turn-helix transcriptional regulator [Mycobacterium sp. 1274761.0]